jgi:signal peptidase
MSAANGKRFVVAAVATVSVGMSGAFVAGRVNDYKYLTVLSGSMVPQLKVGDLVIDENVKVADVRAGEVITFRDPEGGHRLITHRVRSVTPSGDVMEVVTKGDNNNAVESWRMPAKGSVGRVVARVPKVGRLIGAANGRTGRMLLMLAILGWAAYEAMYWRGPRRKPAAAPVPA